MFSKPIYCHLFLFLLGNISVGVFFYYEQNIFLVDNYAKKVSFALAGVSILFHALYNPNGLKFSKFFLVLSCLFLLGYLLRAFWMGNPISFIVLEVIQVSFIYIFATLTSCMSINSEQLKKFIICISIICAITVSLGIKLQFSYAGFLLPFLLIFGYKPNSGLIFLLLICLSFISFYQSLLGKSPIIFITFIAVLLFRVRLFRYKSFYYLIFILTSTILAGYIVYPDLITQTGAYQKLLLFIRYDFFSGDFDISSAQRIYEATRVLLLIENGGINSLLFGNGFGANIDLFYSNDSAVLEIQKNIESVRNIHFLFFYVLLKFGLFTLIPLLSYFFYCIVKFRSNFYDLPVGNSLNLVFRVLVVYTIIIIVDGQVSAGHLLSNPLFIFSLVLAMRIIRIGHGRNFDLRSGRGQLSKESSIHG
jgi:hypothetical protein